jgi:hypothetical protein
MTTYFFWILSAAFLGFCLSAIFTGWLKLSRNVYLLIYIPVVFAFFIFFMFSYDLNPGKIILHNWYWGVTGAIIAGVFVIKNVLSQPSSDRNRGAALLSDILWPGVLYGLSDSLLFSVLPIMAVKSALTGIDWFDNWYGKIAFGAIALLSSLFITTVSHLGYREFRGKKVIGPNVGNGIMSLSYLLTMNPLAAIIPHIGMHIAAMVHGKDTAGQVPPHYKE